MTTDPVFDLHGAFPFASNDDAIGAHEFHTLTLAEKRFLYIGKALTRAEFARYIADYDFGPILPSYVVYHHTAIPSTLAARWPGAGAVWDAGEAGLNEAQIKAKRLRQLEQIRDFYAKDKGWDRGPHIFVDDKWIYLFTPMAEIGIHAGTGNSTHIIGRLVYSIGIEVVGYYEKVVWPEAVRRNAGFVAAALQRRLGTFELRAGAQWHDLTSHRQYGKPSCPGAAITEKYYVQAALDAATQVDAQGEVKALSVHPKLLGAWQMSGGIWLKDRLTPGLPTAAAFIGTDGCLYQRFERSVARLKADGGVDWLLLHEIAALIAPAP
jgi:hypothetical protein